MASRAMQVNTKITGEDSVQLVFGSNYGWQAHMLLNWAGPRGCGPDIVIAGERAVIHLWPGAAYVDLYPAAASPLMGLLGRIPSARLSRLLTRPALQRVRRSISDSDALGYLTEMRAFLAAVAEGRPPVSKPEDARRDLEIVLCAYQALRDGHWVSVP
jgi:predicted dehydrogenase